MPPPLTRETVTLSGDLRLVPVVELEPGPYARLDLPEGSHEEVPMDMEHYWERSLAKAGIQLEPLLPGSWLVPVSRLTDPHVLRQMLRVEMKSIDKQCTCPDLVQREAHQPGRPCPGG
jgi:hypothetical protein